MGCRSGPWQGAWGNGGNTGDRPGRTRWVRCCCLEKFEFLIGRAQLTAGKGGEAAAQTTGRPVPVQPGAWKWRAEVLARRGTVLREGDVDSEVWVSQHSGGSVKSLYHQDGPGGGAGLDTGQQRTVGSEKGQGKLSCFYRHWVGVAGTPWSGTVPIVLITLIRLVPVSQPSPC